MNPFTKQGQALPENVRDRIIFLWHAGQSPSQIALNLNLKRQTVTNIVNNFLARGTADAAKGGNSQKHARTDGICEYIEYCKQRQPSIFAEEIQDLLVENNICLQQNLPSQSSISRCLRSDLGYSYKKLKVVARESLTPEVQELLDRYLAAVCSVNIRIHYIFLMNVLLLKLQEIDVTAILPLASKRSKFKDMQAMPLIQ